MQNIKYKSSMQNAKCIEKKFYQKFPGTTFLKKIPSQKNYRKKISLNKISQKKISNNIFRNFVFGVARRAPLLQPKAAVLRKSLENAARRVALFLVTFNDKLQA